MITLSLFKKLGNWAVKYYYVLFVAVIGLIAVIFYHSQGLITFYNDTTSHLNIARRVIDNLSPGLVQIGSTWLPLLHLAELPFIWNNYLWQSGLAGTLVTYPSFILLGIFLYKTIYLLTKDKLSSFVGILALVGNANILYMQTTPMFEPLFISLSTGSVYYLLKWIKTKEMSSLILASIYVMLASLTRYDGWFYLLFETGAVAIIALLTNGKKYAEGRTILFMTLGSLGVFLWLLYNLLIFGNPLYFAANEYSAFTQQLVYHTRGELPTKGNILYAFANYLLASAHNLGGLISVFSAISFLTAIFYFVKGKQYLLIVWLLVLLTPIIFHTYSLFHGDTIIIVPELSPYGLQTGGLLKGLRVPYFNIRYGLLMLPAAIISLGLFASFSKFFKGIVIFVILLQTTIFYFDFNQLKPEYNFVALKDIIGSRGHIPSIKTDTQYFKSVYDDGLILASSAGTDIELFEAGIPLKNYITEGTGKYWKESMIDPSKYAKWIMMTESGNDRVGRHIRETEGFNKFERIYRGGVVSIYKLKNNEIN